MTWIKLRDDSIDVLAERGPFEAAIPLHAEAHADSINPLLDGRFKELPIMRMSEVEDVPAAASEPACTGLSHLDGNFIEVLHHHGELLAGHPGGTRVDVVRREDVCRDLVEPPLSTDPAREEVLSALPPDRIAIPSPPPSVSALLDAGPERPNVGRRVPRPADGNEDSLQAKRVALKSISVPRVPSPSRVRGE